MAANMMCARIKYFASAALMLLCVAPLAAWGQTLSDPTRPPPGFDSSARTSAVTAAPQVRGLQSVMISAAHCAAIIDGKTVELGAKHGSERLVEISERGVVLQGEHGRRALMLFPAVTMKNTEALPPDQQAVKCQFEQNKNANNPAKLSGQKEKK